MATNELLFFYGSTHARMRIVLPVFRPLDVEAAAHHDHQQEEEDAADTAEMTEVEQELLKGSFRFG
jgi:hypothetical protein